MNKTVGTIWNEALEFIKDNVDEQCYDTWFNL